MPWKPNRLPWMLENPWSAVGNCTSAVGPSGSSFGPSSLAPTGIHHHHLFLSNLTTVRKNFPKRFAKILTRWSVNLIVSMSGCQIRWFRCEHWHSIAFGQEYKIDMLAEGPYSSSHRPPPIALGYIFDHGNGGATENLRSFRLIVSDLV